MVKASHCKRAVSVSVIILFLIASVLPVAGCFGSCFGSPIKAIRFRKESIDLNIGETFRINSSVIEFEPALTSEKDYTLSSSDENIVGINGRNSLIAVGAGVAVVTATSDFDSSVSASLTVNVDYGTPSELFLSFEGERVRYGEFEPTSFTVSGDVELDPAFEFEWRADGKLLEGKNRALTFAPEGIGSHTVSVALPELGLSASAVVKLFSSPLTGTGATYEGQTVQENTYTPVRLHAQWDEADAEPFIDWYVNGEKAAEDVRDFSFTPTVAGVHEITLKINDEPANIDGKSSLTVTAKGSVIPSGITYTFDNIYPQIKISWVSPPAPKMNFGLKIVNLTTGETNETFTTTNASTRPYFDGTSFSAGGFLDLTENVYEISVRSLGDGETYTSSDYGRAVRTELIDKNAVPYLENKVLGSTLDHYMTSDDDFILLNSYYYSFRGNSNIDYKVYMGYTSKLDVDELVDAAFEYGSTVGSYNLRESGSTKKGGIVRVRITCNNSVYPEKSGSSSSTALDALEPHVAYDSTRTNAHVFPIELAEHSQSVYSSEELFKCVEFGVRPLPENGSPAARFYSYARSTLINIISDDMSDIEKVHAVYDWIMWNTVYDREAESVKDASASSKYTAYYLDGVLTDRNAFAVCDGIAKAFSLLCNMEGIPALRVTGNAGSSVAGMSYAEASKVKRDDWGGHAWNKVCVGGVWYAVDATWGDTSVTINKRQYELALHDFLLVSDSDIADTHEYDHTTRNPTTAAVSYNIYEDMGFTDAGGELVDSYIESGGESAREEIEEFLYALADGARERTVGSSYVSFSTLSIGNRTNARSYFGAELTASAGARAFLKNEARNSAAYFGGYSVGLSRANVFDEVLSRCGYTKNDYLILTAGDSVIVALEPIKKR